MIADLKKILVADASGKNVKMALVCEGKIVRQTVRENMAMEGFAQALADTCDSEFDSIEAFALCIGPGSMLSTRVASCMVSVVAALTKAELFSFDIMQTSAFAVAYGLVPNYSDRPKNFRIMAPSRRGHVNVLDFSEAKIQFQKEIAMEDFEGLKSLPTLMLDQRANPDERLADFDRLDLPVSVIVSVLMRNGSLAERTTTAPEPKLLVKREYVKWKAQALI